MTKNRKNKFKQIFPLKKEWNFGQVNTQNINFGSWKFADLYNRKNINKRYLMSALMGCLIGIFSFFLLQGTGIYNLGASGFFQGISRIVSFALVYNKYPESYVIIIYNVLFWVLNFTFNLPLVIFGYYKIGKQFTFLSLISILTSTITGLIFSFIPNLSQFFIFSNPLTFNEILQANNIQILQWFNVVHLPDKSFVNDSSKIIIALIYGVASGIFLSLPVTLIYIIGGSRGGLDWYLFYYSKKKMKFFGLISMYMNFTLTFFSYIIGTYIPYLIIMLNNEPNINVEILISNFFSPILLATLLFAWIRKLITVKIYPQFKTVSLKIYTDKIKEIRNLFLNQKLVQAFTINNSIGGFSLKNHPNIEIVCFYHEVPKILNKVREYDQNCLFVSTYVLSVQGNFRIQSDFD